MTSSATRPSVPHGGHLLVCDARKALLFRNTGTATKPSLEVVETRIAPANPPTRDQGTDQPGRAFSSQGERSAVGQTDWHDQAERQFAREIATMVEAAVRGGGVSALVVAAPPHVLAALREDLGRPARELVIGETAADLTKHPVEQIERHFTV